MHFLVTGHTGFKGAWLIALLKHRGHEVSGIALKPTEESLFTQGSFNQFLQHDLRCDVRDFKELRHSIKKVDPDIVIHMAAQSLVRRSYVDPIETFETNVNGTLNLLKSTQELNNLKAQLIITTDKVYANVNKTHGYKESDPLGGRDPYSASKAMADIATQSWISSFSAPPTAIARAGNVIGGGDSAADRLIPEVIRAYKAGVAPELRFPNSVRPWQFVLDCLSGYLLVVDSLLKGQGLGAWNFGPIDTEIRTAADVADAIGELWGVQEKWLPSVGENPHEAQLLLLDSSKARKELRWSDKLGFTESISWTSKWYQSVNDGVTPRAATTKNVVDFESL